MRKIPRTVIILGLVSFFNDLASEMIYPILPIFLTSVLHTSIPALGVIEGVAEATASISKYGFGTLCASVVGGLLWSHVNPSATFWYQRCHLMQSNWYLCSHTQRLQGVAINDEILLFLTTPALRYHKHSNFLLQTDA